MIKKLKTYIVVAASALTLIAPVAIGAVASAQVTNQDISNSTCAGTNGGFGASTICSGAQSHINQLISTVINVLSVIVGVVAVVMIIFGGFKYIMSGGDSGNISSAKQTIIFALVGLVIVALAQFIVHFVLNKAVNGVQGA
jgi:hypothetical protein